MRANPSIERTAPASRLAVRTSQTALSSALLTTLTIGTATASPDDTSGGFPTPSLLKHLVVLDFELAGDLGGNFEAAHIQRARMASAKLRYALRHSHL